jgi:hypothetical protein
MSMRLTWLVLIWGMFLLKSGAQLLEPFGQNSASAQEKGTENRYQRKLREAREKGGLIADRNLTNVAVGPLNVRKITYGKWHTFEHFEHASEENSLVIWVDVKPGVKSLMFQYEISGSRGETFYQEGGGLSGGEPEVAWIQFNQWPRRDKAFSLRARDEHRKLLGEGTLPNIAQGTFAELIAQPLPVSTNVGGLNIVFKGIEDGTEPIIEFKENGGPAIGWEMGPFFFEDATGNRSGLTEELVHEDVLRCTIRFFRTEAGKFSKDEEWVIPLRVPEPGKYEVLHEIRTMDGLEMSLLATGGAGEITYDQNRPIEGIGTVDSSAEPYTDSVCRFPRMEKPPVFIRGTGRNWAAGLGHKNKTERFSVVGTRPHVAITSKHADVTHRIFVGPQEFFGGMLGEPLHEKSESNWGNVFIVLLAAEPGPTNLRIVVQRARTASFVFQVPASARAFWLERHRRELSVE